MDLVMNFIFFLMALTTINGQQYLYRLHQNFDTIESPQLDYVYNARADRPITGARRQSKSRIRYDDYGDGENDYSEESAYHVGSQITVGQPHPRIAPKHQTKYQPSYEPDFDPSKATTFTSFHIKHEEDEPQKYSGKIKQKPKKKLYFKPVHENHSNEEYYDQGPQVFPSGTAYSKQISNYEVRNSPNFNPIDQNKRYKNVASKGQISKYLEDQEKFTDEQDQFQLLNDPISSSKIAYRDYARPESDESIEKEYEYEEEPRRKPESFYGSSKKPKLSKRPQTRKKSPRKTSVLIPQNQGLGSFRSPKAKTQTIRFHLDI